MKKTNKDTSAAASMFYVCLMVILTTLTVFNITFYYFSKPKISYVINDSTKSKISFWQSFLSMHPSYLAGWVELAKLEMQNGDKSSALIAFQNAWKINPNSIETQKLKSSLEN